jgi:hypothetical protein
MPMRDEHPIDAHFREALAGAEVTPPPAVWAGIREARRSRRLLPPWFRLNGFLLVLLPGAALTTYLLWPAQTPGTAAGTVNTGGAGAATATTPTVPVQETTSEAAPWPDARLSVEDTSPPAGGTARSGQSSTPAAGRAVAPTAATAPPLTTGSITVDPGTAPSHNLQAALVDPAGKPDMGFTERTAGLEFLRVLHPSGTSGAAGLKEVPQPPVFVLPAAEWRLSALVGSSDGRQRWHGLDRELTAALDRAEARTATLNLGLSLERHWMSGWGVGAGIQLERSSRDFHFVDRRTTVQQEVITWLVTLDSQVFVSSSDTIDHVTTTENSIHGINRRSVVRIPVEGHFHRGKGRLQWGLRGGLALELDLRREGPGLTLDRQEGRLTAVQLSSTTLRQRHPHMVLGMVGADLGYQLAEHWSIWATPNYMLPLTPLGPRGEAWATTNRLGLQLRLSHHFTCTRR